MSQLWNPKLQLLENRGDAERQAWEARLEILGKVASTSQHIAFVKLPPPTDPSSSWRQVFPWRGTPNCRCWTEWNGELITTGVSLNQGTQKSAKALTPYRNCLAPSKQPILCGHYVSGTSRLFHFAPIFLPPLGVESEKQCESLLVVVSWPTENWICDAYWDIALANAPVSWRWLYRHELSEALIYQACFLIRQLSQWKHHRSTSQVLSVFYIVTSPSTLRR